MVTFPLCVFHHNKKMFIIKKKLLKPETHRKKRWGGKNRTEHPKVVGQNKTILYMHTQKYRRRRDEEQEK